LRLHKYLQAALKRLSKMSLSRRLRTNLGKTISRRPPLLRTNLGKTISRRPPLTARRMLPRGRLPSLTG